MSWFYFYSCKSNCILEKMFMLILHLKSSIHSDNNILIANSYQLIWYLPVIYSKMPFPLLFLTKYMHSLYLLLYGKESRGHCKEDKLCFSFYWKDTIGICVNCSYRQAASGRISSHTYTAFANFGSVQHAKYRDAYVFQNGYIGW